MITVKELLKREDFFDAAIVRHGFTDYMRDYEIIVAARNSTPNSDIHPPNSDIHKYQFIGCVEANYQTTLNGGFAQSLSDQFVYSGPDYPDKAEPYGFIWGVRFAEAYPGMEYLATGERAEYWSGLMGRKMHEITVETNVYLLRLVFADVRYSFLGNEPEVVLPKDMPLSANERTSDGGVS